MLRKSFLIFILFLLLGVNGISQNKNSFDIFISPFNYPLNKSDLNYDPYGEYGDQYLNSIDYGLKYGREINKVFILMIGLSSNNLNYESYQINPFPTFEKGDELGSNATSTLRAVSLNLSGEFKMFGTKKIDLSLYLGKTLIRPYIFKETIIQEYSESPSQTIVRKENLNNIILHSLNSGIRFRYKLSDVFAISIQPGGTYGNTLVSRFNSESPIEIKKIEFIYPISFSYHW